MDKLKKILSSAGFVYAVILLLLFNYFFLNFFAIQNQQFNSPDEMATVYFLEKYTGDNIQENFTSYNAVHPRSVLLWQGEKVPVAFVGYLYILAPIYKLFSLWGVYFLLFFLAVILCYLFYKTLARVQNKKMALLATVLLIVNPAFFYYLNKPLYHNVLFVLLAFIGFFLYWLKERKWQYLAVFLMALAFWLRPVEIIWLVPLLFWTWSYLRWPWMKRILHFFLSGTLSLFFFLISNYLIYGNPYLFGYILPNQSGEVLNGTAYWGLSLHQVLLNVRDFAFSLFWPWAWLLLLTLILIAFTWRRQNEFIKWNVVALGIVSSILFLYYGSWGLSEHVVPGTISIGNSFARYWLPIYILAVPLISYLMLLLWKFKLKLIALSLGIFLISWSFWVSLWAHDDSLLPVNQTLENYVSQAAYLQQLLPADNMVLVLDRDDKFLSAIYDVIHLPDFSGDEALKEIANLLHDNVPVYYYGFNPSPADWTFLENEIFPLYGYKLLPYLLEEEKSIYKFELVDYGIEE